MHYKTRQNPGCLVLPSDKKSIINDSTNHQQRIMACTDGQIYWSSVAKGAPTQELSETDRQKQARML
jgi:hypothetical protein